MKITSIRLTEETKALIDEFRTHPRETYEELIKKIIGKARSKK